MSNPIISIIVPVYNVENYIGKCLDSILSQTFKCFEVILIDDGSTDSSGKICDEFANKDERIRLVHKENEGVSSARQLGIEKAVGDYIIHVDSDDWIETNMLEEMIDQTKDGCDVLVTDFYRNDDSGAEAYVREYDAKSPDDLMKAILERKCMGSLCNKLIRKKLYDGKVFPRELSYCEDEYMLAQILVGSSLIIKNYHKAFYHYEQRSSSITHTVTKIACDKRQAYVDMMDCFLNQKRWMFRDVMLIKRQEVLITKVRSGNYSVTDIIRSFFDIKTCAYKSEYFGAYHKNTFIFLVNMVLYSCPFLLRCARSMQSILCKS